MEREAFFKFFIGKMRIACRGKKIRRGVLKALAHPFFPTTFFMRNVMTLTEEAGWKHSPPRLQKAKIRRLLEERGVFFLEVRNWMSLAPQYRKHLKKEIHIEDGTPPDAISYCTHCGGCCEVASGFPDFPEETLIPVRWQRIFGEGLGRGHRFCPFLWEEKSTGSSLCSIHPWRSHPCRAFEKEECEFLMNDPDFKRLSDRKWVDRTCRLLLRLIDAG